MRQREDTEGIGSSWWWCLVVAVGLALGAVGCAGSDDPSSTPVEDAPTTTTVAPLTTTTTLPPPTTTQAPTVEFIDLPYWDVHVQDGSFDFRLDTESCDASEPGVEVCDWEADMVFFGTFFGRATTHLEGTMTVESGGCTVADETSGDLTIARGVGSITTAWGDQAYITNMFGSCGTRPLPNTWRVTGGTGLFEDATGLMNGENVQLGDEETSVYVQNLSTGTIRVRKDLWEDWLAPE
jgi:hypothetical protein